MLHVNCWIFLTILASIFSSINADLPKIRCYDCKNCEEPSRIENDCQICAKYVEDGKIERLCGQEMHNITRLEMMIQDCLNHQLSVHCCLSDLCNAAYESGTQMVSVIASLLTVVFIHLQV